MISGVNPTLGTPFGPKFRNIFGVEWCASTPVSFEVDRIGELHIDAERTIRRSRNLDVGLFVCVYVWCLCVCVVSL